MSGRDNYLDLPTPADQRITELHVWVALNEDGSEGILSADMMVEGKKRHMPLVSSKRHLAEAMQPIVNRLIFAAIGHPGRQAFETNLVTFKRCDG